MGKRNWCRHQNVSFIGGVAEHQALVSGTLFFCGFPVHALGDVRRLFADGVQDGTGMAVKTHGRVRVTDSNNRAAYDILEIDPGGSGDLAGDDGHAGLDHGLAGNTCLDILFQNGIQDRIRYLVSNFVGMAFGYGLRSKQKGITHVLDVYGLNTGWRL